VSGAPSRGGKRRILMGPAVATAEADNARDVLCHKNRGARAHVLDKTLVGERPSI